MPNIASLADTSRCLPVDVRRRSWPEVVRLAALRTLPLRRDFPRVSEVATADSRQLLSDTAQTSRHAATVRTAATIERIISVRWRSSFS